MYILLDYFYFPAFDLEVKVTEILTYIVLLPGENDDNGWETNYQVLEKKLSTKIDLLCVIEK